jgi:hypothetical protein
MSLKTKTISLAAVLALALVGAAPEAGAQVREKKVDPSKQAVQAQKGAMRVIALQVRVEDLDNRGLDAGQRPNRYGLAPTTETIPLRDGERVRVHLVGTAIEADGDGVEAPVNARFRVVSGNRSLDVGRTGPNWAEVVARADGSAQLGYTVTGNYDMKGALREGRITFQVGGGAMGGVAAPPLTRPAQGDRWNKAERLAGLLYRGILQQPLQGEGARADVEHIYRLGYGGVLEVAEELASEADRVDRGRYRGEEGAIERVGELYRVLLGRNQSNRDLWDGDRGFRGNVGEFRERGVGAVVDSIVNSEEFRSVQEMHRWGPISGNEADYRNWNEDDWRRARSTRPPVN